MNNPNSAFVVSQLIDESSTKSFFRKATLREYLQINGWFGPSHFLSFLQLLVLGFDLLLARKLMQNSS